MKNHHTPPKTGAEAVLFALKKNDVSYFFANAGTDFPPIIEALATRDSKDMPQPITVPHETASVAMAHGYYLVTGKPQAVMVHVNVGLANAVMGVINAASDNIPVLVMSGRTPITETGRFGSRATPIQYGQEMYDQSSLVRDVVKFNYEMRYPEQGGTLVNRALTIAKSEPKGPVYLSLPREPLGDEIPASAAAYAKPQAVPSLPFPDPVLVAELAQKLLSARNPLILCQRGDVAGELSEALSAFAAKHAIAVAEPFCLRNVLASDDPSLIGYEATAAIKSADVIVVLDCDIPWIELNQAPSPECFIAHVGVDPNFTRMPIRGYQADLALTATPLAAVQALNTAMPEPANDNKDRRDSIEAQSSRRRALPSSLSSPQTGPITAEWMSKCISDIMDEEAVAFTELGLLPQYMSLSGPNRVFFNVHAGGLGWAIPAALGAQLSDRNRLVISVVGDGSYMFANPTACHQIAEALDLPILIIIKNNGMWNAVRRSVVKAYPDGTAAQSNTMPLTSLEPAPNFSMVAQASRAHAEQVLNPQDLPSALQRALRVIREEKRQVLLDLRVAVSDQH